MINNNGSQHTVLDRITGTPTMPTSWLCRPWCWIACGVRGCA
jgi:hypothetical protein